MPKKLTQPRWQAITGLIAAVVLLAAGLLIQHVTRTSSTDTQPTSSRKPSNATYEAEVSQVQLQGLYAGTVTVTPSGRDGKVDVASTGTQTGDLKLTTSIRDSRLVVRQTGSCVSPGTTAQCNARFTVSVPGTAKISANADGAALIFTGLRGDIEARNAGDITVQAARGRLQLYSDIGIIAGRELLSQQVEATNRNGAVNLAFAQAPRRVQASTDNGDVNVRLPERDTYRVDASSGNGPRQVTVKTDDASPRQITVRSAQGSVIVAN